MKERELKGNITLGLDSTHNSPENPFFIAQDTMGRQSDDRISLREREATLPEISFAREDNTTPPEFELGPLIAEGGMGRICSAKQLPLQRDVVIKMLRVEQPSDDMKALLLQEACLTGYLEHPNIIPVYQLGKNEQQQPMLVMKRIDGVPWSQVLEDKKLRPDSLSEEQRSLEWHIRILIQVCHAMEYAHSKGILHRDLKPDNVMIGEFGEVYVLDWGIAASLHESHKGHFPLVRDGDRLVGTPAYIAPEMLGADEELEVDERTDVYLLGAILFQLLVDEPPHSASSLAELFIEVCDRKSYKFPKNIATELAVLCNLSMHLDKKLRPESVKEFRLVLEAFLANSASYKLITETEILFEQLRHYLSSISAAPSTLSMFVPSEEIEEQKIYSLFWRCHFGFTQALQISTKSKEARKSLQSLLEVMTKYEFHRGDVQAAAALIAELPKPNRVLEQGLERLRAEQARKAENIKELKRLKFEGNVEVGKLERQVTMLLLGITFGLFSLFTHYLKVSHIYEPEHYGYLMSHLSFMFLFGVMSFVWRRALFENLVNRQMLGFIAFLTMCLILLRIMYIYMEVSMQVSGLIEIMMFINIAGYLAIAHSLMIFVVTVSYVVVFFCCMFWPYYYFLFLGIAHLFAVPYMTWFWESMSKTIVVPTSSNAR